MGLGKIKQGSSSECTGTFVLYEEQMLRLLACPKPAHDQLCFELPMLMGFRSEEVCTWKAEYIDFERGDTLVFDAKKHELVAVPLNIQVAAHAEQVLKGRSKGYVLENLSSAWRERFEAPSTVAVWYIWKKWEKRLGLPNANEIKPLTGCQFLAAEWFYRFKLNLVTLQMIMRHGDSRVTLGYVSHLIFYEDLSRLQTVPIQPNESSS